MISDGLPVDSTFAHDLPTVFLFSRDRGASCCCCCCCFSGHGTEKIDLYFSGFLCLSYGFPMLCSWLPMVFLWFPGLSWCFRIVFLLFDFVSLIAFLWLAHGFHVSYTVQFAIICFLMGLLWGPLFSYGAMLTCDFLMAFI